MSLQRLSMCASALWLASSSTETMQSNGTTTSNSRIEASAAVHRTQLFPATPLKISRRLPREVRSNSKGVA